MQATRASRCSRADAYEAIADFTEGIPRNVNNFCFNALSLGYATQKKLLDLDTVKEVISDLDISKLTTGGARVSEAEPEPIYVPMCLCIRCRVRPPGRR